MGYQSFFGERCPVYEQVTCQEKSGCIGCQIAKDKNYTPPKILVDITSKILSEWNIQDYSKCENCGAILEGREVYDRHASRCPRCNSTQIFWIHDFDTFTISNAKPTGV